MIPLLAGWSRVLRLVVALALLVGSAPLAEARYCVATNVCSPVDPPAPCVDVGVVLVCASGSETGSCPAGGFEQRRAEAGADAGGADASAASAGHRYCDGGGTTIEGSSLEAGAHAAGLGAEARWVGLRVDSRSGSTESCEVETRVDDGGDQSTDARECPAGQRPPSPVGVLTLLP